MKNVKVIINGYEHFAVILNALITSIAFSGFNYFILETPVKFVIMFFIVMFISFIQLNYLRLKVDKFRLSTLKLKEALDQVKEISEGTIGDYNDSNE